MNRTATTAPPARGTALGRQSSSPTEPTVHWGFLKPDFKILEIKGMQPLLKCLGERLLEFFLRRHEVRSTQRTSPRESDSMEDWCKLVGDVPSARANLDPLLQDSELVPVTRNFCWLRGPQRDEPELQQHRAASQRDRASHHRGSPQRLRTADSHGKRPKTRAGSGQPASEATDPGRRQRITCVNLFVPIRQTIAQSEDRAAQKSGTLPCSVANAAWGTSVRSRRREWPGTAPSACPRPTTNLIPVL